MGASQSKKAMGELKKLEGFATVGVAVQKPMYTAGEIVIGYVQVTVHQTVEIECLDVELAGKAITGVHYTTQHTTGSGDNQRTTTEHHQANQTDVVVQGQARVATSAGAQLLPGTYQYPFQLQIPPAAPSSVALIGTIGGYSNHAQLVYSVGVHCRCPGWSHYETPGLGHLCHTVPLDVVSVVQHAIVPQRQQDEVKVTKCGCCNAGQMEMGSVTDKNAYQRGESITVNYHVGNDSTVDVDHVNVKLYEAAAWSAQGHGHKIENVLQDLSQPGVAKGAKEKGEKHRASGERSDLQVQVPVPASSNFEVTSATLQISHRIEIVAHTASGFTKNPKLGMPLTLYRTQPLPVVIQAVVVGTAIAAPYATVLEYQPSNVAAPGVVQLMQPAAAVTVHSQQPLPVQAVPVQAVPVQKVYPGPAPLADMSPASKIRSLKQLLDVGALTQEEFDQKKSTLLTQM
jgi:hypothetical protein